MTREPRVIYDLSYKSTNYDGGYHVIRRFYHYGVLINKEIDNPPLQLDLLLAMP